MPLSATTSLGSLAGLLFSPDPLTISPIVTTARVTTPPTTRATSAWQERVAESVPVWRVWGIAVALIAMLWAAACVVTVQDRQHEEMRWRLTTENVARMLEEHAARSMTYVDEALIHMKGEYARRGAAFDLARYFEESHPSRDLLINGVITNARGDVVLTSSRSGSIGVNLADREHVRTHISHDSGNVYISAPLQARVAGKPSVIMTRRLNHADGTFAGVAAIAFDPGYFTNFYQQVSLGPQSAFMLVGLDGIVRSRIVDGRDNQALDTTQSDLVKRARSSPQGTYITAGQADGGPRILSYRNLRRYPLLVAAGAAEETAFAGVRERRTQIVAAAAAGTLLILLIFAWLLLLMTRAHHAHQRSIEVEGLRQRLMAESADATLLTRDGIITYANPAAQKLLGATDATDLLGRTIDTLACDATASGDTHNTPAEQRYRKLDGGSVDVEQSISEIRTDAATTRQWILRDITLRKQAQAAARSNEQLHHLASEAAGATDWEWNIAEDRLYWGRHHAALLGPLPEGQQRYPDFRAMVHAEDRDYYLAAGRAALDHDAHYEVEFRLVRTDGRIVWVRNMGRVTRDTDGRPLRMLGISLDITRRHEAETALTTQTRHFISLLEGLPVPAWLKDTHGRFVAVNHTWCERHEKTAQQTLGQKSADIFPPEIAALHKAEDQLVMATRAEQRIERTRQRHGEARCWFEVVKTPILGPAGDVSGVVGVSYDTTAHKLTQDALSRSNEVLEKLVAERNRALTESENRFRHVAEATGGYVWELNAKREYIYVSEWMEKLLGYTAAEMLGRTPKDFMPAGEWERISPWLDVHSGPDGSFRNLEHRTKTKHGRIVWQQVQATAVRDGAGKIIGTRGAGLDITERKLAELALRESEERYRDLVENSHDMICTHDLDGRLLSVNNAMVRILGYPRESLIGRNVADLLTPQSLKDLPTYLKDIRANGSAEGVMAMTTADGTVRYFDLRNTLREDKGEAPVARSVARDITERWQAQRVAAAGEASKRVHEAQLAQSQKLKAIGTLAGGIAHDFNNILPVILGNLELAREEIGSEHPAQGPLAEIQKAGSRAKELVQRILAFSSARSEDHRQVIDLQPVIREAVSMLGVARPANVRIITHFAEHGHRVRADATQVHQIIINLCANAWHAMAGRDGKIDITLDNVNLDLGDPQRMPHLPVGPYLRLCIRDNGRGMDEATRKRIFEPFFTTRDIGQGTGLGLSIVHSIVSDHQGHIEVRSAPGQGAGFLIYLPAARSADEAPSTLPVTTPSGLRHSTRVVYIDDDEALVLLMTRALERRGYTVLGYSDAQEAIAMIKKEVGRIDLVVTDYRMPMLSGLDVARQVIAFNPQIKLAIVSGFVTGELQLEANALNIEVIRKPDSMARMVEEIKRLAGL